MIACGAQIKAGRALLGWSQKDLAEAAGLHQNAVRYLEASHARPFPSEKAIGYGSERIAAAFVKAGLTLAYSPPGVAYNPDIYRAKTPPRAKRWEKHYKPGSKRSKERESQIKMARLIRGWPQMPAEMALEYYAEIHAGR
jgi:transcriptional regulator with XRE-family HTH domain